MKGTSIKRILAAAIAMSLVVSVAGCGKTGEQATASTAGESTAAASTEAAAKPSALRIITWSNQSSVDAINELSKKYMEKYPNVKVDISVVDTDNYPTLQRTRLQANDVDIVTMGGGFVGEKVDWAPGAVPEWQQLIDSGVFTELTNQPWVANWSTGAKAGTYKGKVYAISTGANATTGIFYNKKLFDEQSLKVPETWAEFEQLCAELKARNITPMTCGGQDQWPYQMLVNDVMAGLDIDYTTYAKGLWTGEKKFNDADGLMVFERMEFINNNMEKNFMSIPYSAVISRFVSGKAAMLPDGAWQAGEITKANKDFQFGYFPMPGTNKGVNFQGKFDLFFAVNDKSENKDNALNLLAILSDKESYTAFVNKVGFIPTMDGVNITNEFLASLLPYTSDLKNSWELEYRIPVGVGQYAQNKGFNPQFLKSAGGSINTIQELADLTQKDFEKAAAANKSK